MSRLLHILFTLYASSLVACDIDGPVPECDYNVLIAYSYTTGSGNEIGDCSIPQESWRISAPMAKTE